MIDIRKTLTIKYIIALSLIAILSTVSFFSLQNVLNSSQSTGYIVNISGKQRMLSQHIALDAHRIHTYINQGKYTQKNDLAKHILQTHTQEMLSVNKILSTGKLPNKTVITLSNTVSEMYFGEMNLAKRVEEYIKIAEQLLVDRTPTEVEEVVNDIDKYSESLLTDLNKVVQQYQLEGEKKLSRIQTLETITWILTIITLLLIVIFIFQPMIRKIASLAASNKLQIENLESQVELRTVHLEKVNDKLRNLAFHDPLTGLRNRLTLENDIEAAINSYTLHHSPYAVIMIDIDWFKSVNDTYGHDIGDFVLEEIASILKESVREGDKVYRAGGEEFVILLNRVSYAESLSIAEKIRLIVQDHTFKTDNLDINKTISSGLYHSSITEAKDTKTVLKLVDSALYASKSSGRNKLTYVNKDMTYRLPKEDGTLGKIIFTDKELSSVIDMNEEAIKLTCCDDRELLNNHTYFKAMLHKDDIHVLDNIPNDSTVENPFKTTVRMIKDDKVNIYSVEIYMQGDTVVMNIQDATNLAQGVDNVILVKSLNAMLENSDDYIYFKDRNHVFIAASKSLVDLTSVKRREDLVGQIDYNVFPKDLADEYFKLERDVFDKKLDVSKELQPTLDDEGNKAWVDNRKYPIKDDYGNIIGLFGIARIISENECSKLQ